MKNRILSLGFFLIRHCRISLLQTALLFLAAFAVQPSLFYDPSVNVVLFNFQTSSKCFNLGLPARFSMTFQIWIGDYCSSRFGLDYSTFRVSEMFQKRYEGSGSANH